MSRYIFNPNGGLWPALERPQQVTEVDLDEDRDVSFLNSEDEELDHDPPCCPPGAENKWRPETWCNCR